MRSEKHRDRVVSRGVLYPFATSTKPRTSDVGVDVDVDGKDQKTLNKNNLRKDRNDVEGNGILQQNSLEHLST